MTFCNLSDEVPSEKKTSAGSEAPDYLSAFDASLTQQEELSAFDASLMQQEIPELPPELLREYVFLSCLKYSEQSVTCLLRQKSTGKTVLLKTASDPLLVESLTNEKKLLELIHRQSSPCTSAFPVPLHLEPYGDTWFYIRSYIPGTTLEDLCESPYRKPGLEAIQAIDYLIGLTELLHFLHTLSPPIIHRDIKPQNIIIDTTGHCHFIDLGISRFYEKAKRSDTVIMGTRLTAPPEQFGYQQTDIRSDLYSLGIVLLYCITGEYDPAKENLQELDPAISRIIERATMFDPNRRYQSAAELIQDLLAVRYQIFSAVSLPADFRKLCFYRKAAAMFAVLSVVLMLCLGLLLRLPGAPAADDPDIFRNSVPGSSAGTKPENDSVIPSSAGSAAESGQEIFYTFTEPLIEEAVRQKLNKPEGILTEQDLLKITELHIIGLQIYSDDSEVWFRGEHLWMYDDKLRENGLYEQKGPIRSLEDISHLPNLVSLSLYGQQITDLSPLKDLPLRELGIGHNPVTDLSPLAGNASIEYLNVASLNLDRIDPLTTLSGLGRLNISGTGLQSIAGLENCPIRELNIFGLELNDYSELRALPRLQTLELNYIDREIIDSLAGMPISELSVTRTQEFSLDQLNVLPHLQKLYFSGDINHFPELLIGTPDLPELEALDLAFFTITDFSSLAALTSLEELEIYGSDCRSYSGLDSLPKLQSIGCTREQWDDILRIFPDHSFRYLY